MRPRAAVLAGMLALVAGGSAACGIASADPGVRTIHITIHHSAFVPELIDVRPGETIRFVLENTDPIDHEFIVGDERVQQVHEEGTEAHHAPRPGEISVPAGEIRITTYAFPHEATRMLFGCHLPGHYDYGMRGTISIR
jgi:uncharacterized cupredoxin-like copper-binding protein